MPWQVQVRGQRRTQQKMTTLRDAIEQLSRRKTRVRDSRTRALERHRRNLPRTRSQRYDSIYRSFRRRRPDPSTSTRRERMEHAMELRAALRESDRRARLPPAQRRRLLRRLRLKVLLTVRRVVVR